MNFEIITIFPDSFNSYFNESIIKRAKEKKLVNINIHNLRDYTKDKHRTVDDKPYGGGPGMIMKAEPIYRAVKRIKGRKKKKIKTILFSSKGKRFNQKMAKEFSKLDRLIMVCGRYEGVDERVARYVVDEEVSVGDYILTGGELPAMIVVDAVSRLVPGVITKESLKEESFSKDFYYEYPQYTRPETININNKKRKVPDILLSGNHKKIKEWREKYK
ncbi:MAG: tRNA (guanosine(37)-N1)-methyltransferase TrmD [Candidatus Portnoybacteria bacterium]|nr:tRNA (guanosine(37)-N1)-methyltransferase TrmD [Candidatus Portnoybacteria bacterium]